MNTTIAEQMRRTPRLTAHMVAESLGYFTPESAANALLHHKDGQPYFCEWYMHMNGFRKASTETEYRTNMIDVGRDVISNAFRKRKYHRGYMASYEQAMAIVQANIKSGRGPVFASWF